MLGKSGTLEKYGWVLLYKVFNNQAELLYIGRVKLQMKEVIDKFDHKMPSKLEEGKAGIKEMR